MTFATAAVTTRSIAFGGLDLGARLRRLPVAAVLRLETAMEPAGSLVRGSRAARGMPARKSASANVTFAYPARRTSPFWTDSI